MKYFLYLFLLIISIGTLALLQNKWKRIFIWLACEEAQPEQAQYALIKDSLNKYHLVPVRKENYNDINPNLSNEAIDKLTTEQMEQSPYLGFEGINSNEQLTFCYHFNKYALKKTTNSFRGVSFDLSSMKHIDIQETFNKEGDRGILSISLYNYLYNKFGPNIIQFSPNSFLTILRRIVLTPIYLYDLGAIILWFVNNHNVFAIVVLVLFIITLLGSAYKTYSNFESLKKTMITDQVKVHRRFSFQFNKEWNSLKTQVIPGDILTIEEGDSIPCDCVILNGSCTVDVSDLTGESHLITKTELPYDEVLFSNANSHNHILYQGCKLTQCYSLANMSRNLTVLAIDTGNNSYRGNLLQNFDMFNNKSFSFFEDLKYFIIFIFVSWIVVSLVLIVMQLDIEFINYFDSLLVMFTPCLSLSLSFSLFLFNLSLGRYRLSCFIDKKLNYAGKINTILLDKTGTLTKEVITVKGFYSTCITKGKLVINGKPLPSPSDLNKILKKFWIEVKRRNLNDYHNDPKNNLIYFIECLASCQGLLVVNDVKEGLMTLGDSIDQQLFDLMKWNMSTVKESISFKEKREILYITPPNSFEISETHKSKRGSLQAKEEIARYKLEYLNNFDFCSNSQSQSVIVGNTFNGTTRLYTKGAPERVKACCKVETIPENYDSFYLEKAEKGYRILACATKLLVEGECLSKREELERDMTFIGFIILLSPLKKNTKSVISKLLKSNLKIAMVSGDNAYTCISVARECGLISQSNSVYLLDYNPLKKLFVINCLSSNESNINENDNKIKRANWKSKQSEDERSKGKKMSDSSSNRTLIGDKLDSTLKINELSSNHPTNLSQLAERIQSIMRSTNSLLCVNGPAWMALNEDLKMPSVSNQQTTYNLILDAIQKRGVIFSRMIPTQKVKLVKFLKKSKDSTVCMCGDGVNDSIALMAADVGLSLSKWVKGNTLISHFYSPSNSIQIIEVLLRCGKASYENNSMLFKFLFIYGIIQLSNLFIFIYFELDYKPVQYLYIDLFCCLIPAVLSSRSAPLDELNTQSIQSSLINSKYLFGLIGQSILQCLFQVSYTLFVIQFAMIHVVKEVETWLDLSEVSQSLISIL